MFGIPYALLGFRIAGDIGGVTCYTDKKHRVTVYPIAPPKEPASVAQSLLRSRFGSAQSAWAALPDVDKRNLEDACRAASLRLTGQNLYISAAMKGQNASVQAIGRQTNISLPTVPYIP